MPRNFTEKCPNHLRADSVPIRWILALAGFAAVAIWLSLQRGLFPSFTAPATSALSTPPPAQIAESTSSPSTTPNSPDDEATGPASIDIETWLKDHFASLTSDQLGRTILKLDVPTRDRVLEKVAAEFRQEPDQWFLLIDTLVRLLSPGEASLAARLLSRIRDDSTMIAPLERKLIQDWAERDFGGVTKYFEDFLKNEAFVPIAQVDALVSMTQSQRVAKFVDLLNWANGLRGEENRRLKVAVAEALIRQGTPDNFHRIAAFLEPDIDNGGTAGCASQLAARHAVKHPEEAIRWLESLAPKAAAWGPVLVEVFFEQLGRAHPEIAIRLINAGFTDQFAGTQPPPGEERQARPNPATQEELYDKALSRVLDGVLGANPSYALSCTEFFNDPKLQADYKQRAIVLISSTVGQKAGLKIPR